MNYEVLIVDDHPLFRAALKGTVAAACTNCEFFETDSAIRPQRNRVLRRCKFWKRGSRMIASQSTPSGFAMIDPPLHLRSIA